MLNVIVSVDTATGKIWKFHWDGTKTTPFTQAEMDADAAEVMDARERLAADLIQKFLVETEAAAKERDSTPPSAV